jgi:hypothetical protein
MTMANFIDRPSLICRRNSISLAAIVFSMAFAAPAIAQLDSEPANDTAAGADALSLAVGDAKSNLAGLAAPNNDVDYYSISATAGDVLIGMTTPLADLPFSFELPDTMMSVFDGATPLTFSDDDEGGALSSSGSVFSQGSLFRLQAPTTTTYRAAITGFSDLEFDGAASGGTHSESGPYVLTTARIDPTVSGGDFADTDPSNDTFGAGADLISIGASGASVAVSELLDFDVDFYELHLTAGQILSTMTAPLEDLPVSFEFPDTLIALFDSEGTELVTNDDAGDNGSSELHPELSSNFPGSADLSFASALRARIPSDGVYYLGVTGFGDEAFVGDHVEFGRYALLVGVHDDDAPPELIGDFNEDGSVNAADYVVWRKFFGNPFDEIDYDDWVANYGEPGGGAGGGAAPEPTSTWLLFSAGAWLLMLRQRNCVFRSWPRQRTNAPISNAASSNPAA